MLASFTAADSPSGNTHGDPEASMADVANSLCLLRGLPVPRHSEGGFVSALLASVGSSRWVAHFEDLLQQRWWYAKLFYQYENLAGGPDDIEVYYQDAAASAATDGSYTNQALAWLKQPEPEPEPEP